MVCVSVSVVLKGTPQAFDEDIVETTAFSIHADLNLRFQQSLCEDRRGILTSLIAVEDLRFRPYHRFFQRLHVENHVHRIEPSGGESSKL